MNTYKYLISDCITTVYATRIECLNVARYIAMKLMVSKVREYITMRMMVSMVREYTGEIDKHIRGHVIRINE